MDDEPFDEDGKFYLFAGMAVVFLGFVAVVGWAVFEIVVTIIGKVL